MDPDPVSESGVPGSSQSLQSVQPVHLVVWARQWERFPQQSVGVGRLSGPVCGQSRLPDQRIGSLLT